MTLVHAHSWQRLNYHLNIYVKLLWQFEDHIPLVKFSANRVFRGYYPIWYMTWQFKQLTSSVYLKLHFNWRCSSLRNCRLKWCFCWKLTGINAFWQNIAEILKSLGMRIEFYLKPWKNLSTVIIGMILYFILDRKSVLFHSAFRRILAEMAPVRSWIFMFWCGWCDTVYFHLTEIVCDLFIMANKLRNWSLQFFGA